MATRIEHLQMLVFVLLVSLLISGNAAADQTASQLPELFDELRAAESGAEATRIEASIWMHWLEAPDEVSASAMQRIAEAMEGADLQIALQFSNQLVESHPEFAEAWNKRATIHYMLGNNAQSVSDIRQTVALEPRHFGAISGLGLIFLRERNLEAALSAFEQVLAISPASVSAQRSVERLRQELGLGREI